MLEGQNLDNAGEYLALPTEEEERKVFAFLGLSADASAEQVESKIQAMARQQEADGSTFEDALGEISTSTLDKVVGHRTGGKNIKEILASDTASGLEYKPR